MEYDDKSYICHILHNAIIRTMLDLIMLIGLSVHFFIIIKGEPKNIVYKEFAKSGSSWSLGHPGG